jgi:ABC-2 type transport system permease protein
MMLADILVIVWKELKEIVYMRGRQRTSLVSMVVVLGMFGILLPLQFGPTFLTTPFSALYWAELSYLLVAGVIPDTIAGERERHTLETLLASRLSDSAILIGKVAATMVYGMATTILAALFSMVTVSLKSQSVVIIPPLIALLILGVILLTTLFAAGLGVNISLRAPTVRQAGQVMSVMMFLVIIPVFFLPMLPQEWLSSTFENIQKLNWISITVGISLFVILLDTSLIAIAMGRFKRSKLILD